jgi:hypothetical protein
MESVVITIGMFVLRLGIPLAITLAIGYWLRRLDAKWEAEAIQEREQEQAPAEIKALKAEGQPCWKMKGCDEDRRAQCPACKLLDIPCWVARLRATGQLPLECHNCARFAPGRAT